LPRPVRAHNAAGRVQPALPAPALALTRHDGRAANLPALLQGQVTALQLMFTGCTATCPIQGAMFAAVQAGLVRQKLKGVQLLSLSIDPLGDSPPALARWLKALGAGPHWHAAVPRVAGVDVLFDFLRGRSVEPDRHTAQIYLFDPGARLLLRSTDFPTPHQVLGWLATAPRRS
jgi:protein SCO1